MASGSGACTRRLMFKRTVLLCSLPGLLLPYVPTSCLPTCHCLPALSIICLISDQHLYVALRLLELLAV